MKKQNMTLITAASLAAAALSFSPAAFGQVRPASGTGYNQPYNPDATSERNNPRATDTATAPSADQAATPGSAGATATLRSRSSDTVRVAAKDETRRTAQKLAGAKVRGTDGKDLGTVKDFLLDPLSGEIRFAVLSSGGFMGVGDKLHLVPFASLQPDADGKRFTIAMTTNELAQVPTVKEEQFEENRVPAEGSAAAPSSAVASSDTADSGAHTLLRATKIHGRDVKAGGDKIGSIEAVVIEEGSSKALALLDPARDLGASGEKFLVPLNRFTLTSKDDVTTTLTWAEFKSAAQSGHTASADISTSNAASNNAAMQSDSVANVSSTRQSQNVAGEATSGTAAVGALAPKSTGTEAMKPETGANGYAGAQVKDDEKALTPTGQTSADQTPAGDPKLITAAHAVREALDNDATTAHADIRVLPENGKISLRGKVSSDSQKSAIESKAQNAANGCEIDSQLRVENQ